MELDSRFRVEVSIRDSPLRPFTITTQISRRVFNRILIDYRDAAMPRGDRGGGGGGGKNYAARVFLRLA